MPRIAADLSSLLTPSAPSKNGPAPNAATAAWEQAAQARLSAASARNAGGAAPNAARAPDSAEVSAASSVRLATLLKELRGLVDESGRTESISERDALQTRIDQTLSSVERIAGTNDLKSLRRAGEAPGVTDGQIGANSFTFSNIGAGVRKFAVRAAPVTAGNSLDVNVNITASAQQGALRLSFGGSFLNLNGASSAQPTDRFVIEISGRRGSRELSFTSGTSLSTIRNTINTFAFFTGVSAALSGPTGIRLTSQGHTDDDFVSVTVLDDAGAVGSGVHSYQDAANYSANPAGVTFNAAANAVRDNGQSIRALINGATAVGNGLELRTHPADGLQVDLLLTLARAQSLGVFRALTITGVADQLAPTPGANGHIGSGAVYDSLGRTSGAGSAPSISADA